MKKLILVTFVLVICVNSYSQIGSINSIRDISLIEKLDREHFNDGYSIKKYWDTIDPYLTKNAQHFVIDNWLYIISYEPYEENAYQRKGYLYKKNIVKNSRWVKASFSPILEHGVSGKDLTQYFSETVQGNGKSWSSGLLSGECENVVFVILHLRYTYDYNYISYSHPVILYPTTKYNDNSYYYKHISLTNFSFLKELSVDSREGNIFNVKRDGVGGKLIIKPYKKRYGAYMKLKNGESYYIDILHKFND